MPAVLPDWRRIASLPMLRPTLLSSDRSPSTRPFPKMLDYRTQCAEQCRHYVEDPIDPILLSLLSDGMMIEEDETTTEGGVPRRRARC